jgi:hypothetical protein
MEVTTREASQPDARGVQFTCRIDAPLIEMKWLTRPHGTTIRIRVTNRRVFDQLADGESWDWYRMKTPSLVRKMVLQPRGGPSRRALLKRDSDNATSISPRTPVYLPSMETLPERSGPLPSSWRRLALRDSSTAVMWTFSVPTHPVTSDDACDGFVLRRPDSWRRGFDRLWPANRNERGGELYLNRPRLSIFDPDKSIPIDLRRTALTDLPFERELTDAICREVLAALILRTETTRPGVFRQLEKSFYAPVPETRERAQRSLYHPAVSSSSDQHQTAPPLAHRVSWLALGPKGLIPATISPGTSGTTAFVFGDVNTDGIKASFSGQAFTLVPEDMRVRTCAGDARSSLAEKARLRGAGLLIPLERWETETQVDWLPEHTPHRDVGHGWVWAWTSRTAECLLERLSLREAQPGDGSVLFIPDATAPADAVDPLTKLWLDLLGAEEIPLGRAERRVTLARAFHELDPEIRRLESEGLAPSTVAT